MPEWVTMSDGAVVTPSTSPDVVPAVRHKTIDQTNAIDGGRMDGWQNIPGCEAPAYACVSGYQPGQIPNLALLAQDFAISDETFSMADSPSFIGHIYAVAASTDGFGGPSGPNPYKASGVPQGAGWGCDSDKIDQWTAGGVTRVVPSCIPSQALTFNGSPLPNGGAFKPSPVPYTPTIMDRLNTAGLNWKLYGARCASERVSTTGLETCTKASAQSLAYGWSICPTFAECLYSQAASMAPNSQFTRDATSGNLPALSVVTPGNDTVSEHNGFSMAAGDNWLGQQVAAAMNSPEWDSTAIFITWDDCGCFYDQVVPGTNPDGTQQGPRVPLVIVSPWVRAGYTDTIPTTFAGILAYTERNFELAPLAANDAAAYPFSNAFDYSQPPLPGVRMSTRTVPKSDHIDWSQEREAS
jgi:phospholipase C